MSRYAKDSRQTSAQGMIGGPKTQEEDLGLLLQARQASTIQSQLLSGNQQGAQQTPQVFGAPAFTSSSPLILPSQYQGFASASPKQSQGQPSDEGAVPLGTFDPDLTALIRRSAGVDLSRVMVSYMSWLADQGKLGVAQAGTSIGLSPTVKANPRDTLCHEAVHVLQHPSSGFVKATPAPGQPLPDVEQEAVQQCQAILAGKPCKIFNSVGDEPHFDGDTKDSLDTSNNNPEQSTKPHEDSQCDSFSEDTVTIPPQFKKFFNLSSYCVDSVVGISLDIFDEKSTNDSIYETIDLLSTLTPQQADLLWLILDHTPTNPSTLHNKVVLLKENLEQFKLQQSGLHNLPLELLVEALDKRREFINELLSHDISKNYAPVELQDLKQRLETINKAFTELNAKPQIQALSTNTETSISNYFAGAALVVGAPSLTSLSFSITEYIQTASLLAKQSLARANLASAFVVSIATPSQIAGPEFDTFTLEEQLAILITSALVTELDQPIPMPFVSPMGSLTSSGGSTSIDKAPPVPSLPKLPPIQIDIEGLLKAIRDKDHPLPPVDPQQDPPPNPQKPPKDPRKEPPPGPSRLQKLVAAAVATGLIVALPAGLKTELNPGDSLHNEPTDASKNLDFSHVGQPQPLSLPGQDSQTQVRAPSLDNQTQQIPTSDTQNSTHISDPSHDGVDHIKAPGIDSQTIEVSSDAKEKISHYKTNVNDLIRKCKELGINTDLDALQDLQNLINQTTLGIIKKNIEEAEVRKALDRLNTEVPKIESKLSHEIEFKTKILEVEELKSQAQKLLSDQTDEMKELISQTIINIEKLLKYKEFSDEFRKELTLLKAEIKIINELVLKNTKWFRGEEIATEEFKNWCKSQTIKTDKGEESINIIIVARSGHKDSKWLEFLESTTNAQIQPENNSQIQKENNELKRDVYIRKDARKIELIEEILHRLQEETDLNIKVYPWYEIHVKDFMIRHYKRLGIPEKDVQVLKKLLELQMNSGKDEKNRPLVWPPSYSEPLKNEDEPLFKNFEEIIAEMKKDIHLKYLPTED